ncbi:hypothetical protein DLD77_10085 [Chitinophaga alhagiae]|uniref:Uncharacterized protein n=1 Tax=Chitinophaga alhagiae TaxID=2203219 RepID=A0ABN5LRP2_9BACT|nr:hypothetical protein [Chitinophaga alhagiae]AWO02017.1 hypothetical protein DLD77_10085 [Chitinophaga alhagiae]
MGTYKLSTIEQSTVLDADFLLRKNRIIEKVFLLFGELQTAMAAEPAIAGVQLPGGQPAKISKGEQYQGLPYVVLDYPRLFGREDIFACRSFFWWGRFFSITLHLAGASLDAYRARLAGMREQLGDWHVCVQEDAWEHHFEADNYRAATSLTAGEWEGLMQGAFVKLAKKYALQDWENVVPNAVADYTVLLKMLGKRR